MFEKLKSIYEKIINMIIPKKRIYQLETSNLEKEEQLINEKETHKNLKMQIYPFDEKEAQNILKEIKKESPETSINIEEIKKNYSKYKSIQEQGKIKWLKSRRDNIPLDDYIEIINALSKEDMKYISNTFGIGVKLVTKAIYSMGINTFMQLKENGELNKLLNIDNYVKIWEEISQQEKELLLAFRRNDLGEHLVNQFYLYYDFIKENEPEKVNMLLTNNTDEANYINQKTNDDKSGYKWVEDILVVPPAYKMMAIKNMDTKLILDIREKSKIPLNVITTAMLELNLFEENNRDDLEKILLITINLT